MKTLDKIKELQSKNSKTKVCPICGAEPKLEYRTYDPWGDGGGDVTEYWFECSGCGIIKAGSFSTYSSSVTKAQEECLADWNEVVDYLTPMIKK